MSPPGADPSPRISIIAAVARNGGIGRGNDLVWREPEDLKRFKRLTLGSPIIMGRRTWDSIARALPGRRNIVVTRNDAWHGDGAERAASLAAALRMTQGAPAVFVIGGAQLYAEALPLAHELLLTEIDADLEADVFFPEWNRSHFGPTASEAHVTGQGQRYRFTTYRRHRGD